MVRLSSQDVRHGFSMCRIAYGRCALHNIAPINTCVADEVRERGQNRNARASPWPACVGAQIERRDPRILQQMCNLLQAAGQSVFVPRAAIIAVAILLTYRYAHRVSSRIGINGTMVLVRLSDFIMLCIGVGISWHGIKSLLGEIGIHG